MPHHWRPLEPGNPDCGDAVRQLQAKYGEGLKYVGFDGAKCWGLYETSGPEEEDEAQRPHPCERRNLKDEYVKDGWVTQD
jgi:hypothetical protein